MIERAVASLESGQLQRLLPKTRRATRKPRRLVTAFWQHSASALELSSFWPLPQPSTPPLPAPAKSASVLVEPKLVATSFLLDFLYPNDTQSFLHRVLGPRPKSNRLRPLRRRHYSAPHAASTQQTEASVLVSSSFDDASRHASEDAFPIRPLDVTSKSVQISEARVASNRPGASKEMNEMTESQHSQISDEAFYNTSSTRARVTSPSMDDTWNRYKKSTPEQQKALRPGLILTFSRSDSLVECSRAAALFREIPKCEWTDELLSASIRALTFCGKLSAAMDRFKEGLEYNFLGGMQYIIASAAVAQKWPQLLEAWFTYWHLIRHDAKNGAPFDYLASVPTLDRLFLAFEKHNKYTGLAKIRAENKKLFSRDAFEKLRWTIATSALAKPCQPNRALSILALFNDTALYQLYIESMLHGLQDGTQSKSDARQLDSVYSKYRQQPDAEFTQPILRGMLKLYYPQNTSGLAQLFQDWNRTEGGLDKWAYEKFLAFYAAFGDVTAVRDLWRRYVTAFPGAAKNTSGFYSLMDAYAQSGDAASAERELGVMQSSEVPVDIVIRNALLKCYVNAGKHDKAKTYFAEIVGKYEPNSETFSHIMELHSANGDLEHTVAVFNEAQAALVAPSKCMVKSLVMAYLHNGLAEEAEEICREMARRGITSTEIWNRLIYARAMDGKLEKCFQLLPTMRSNNLSWDHDTCEVVLLAQSRARQTNAAHRLLRSAVADNLLPIGANHFAIVMNSAINTNQVSLVEILATEMERAGIQSNFATHLSRFEAGFVRAPTTERTARLAKELVQYLRSLLHDNTVTPTLRNAGPYTVSLNDVTELNRELRHVGDAVKLLMDKREMVLAEELISFYSQIRPVSQRNEHLPSSIISVIMGAYLEEGQDERVLQLWALILRDVRKRTENPGTKKVFPVYAYELSAAIAHVAKVYRNAGDGKRLLAYTQAALDAGFRFTRSTWNTLICCLADLGQWEPAMAWCETLLMPRWRGWANHRPPLAVRHELSNARALVASRPAVLSLQREWLRLRKLAAWSAGVTAKLQRIETLYPRLHHAFCTAEFGDLPETWGPLAGAGGGMVAEMPPSLNKAITRDALHAMPLEDLLAMRLNLEGQLKTERERVARQRAERKGLVYVPMPKGMMRRRF